MTLIVFLAALACVCARIPWRSLWRQRPWWLRWTPAELPGMLLACLSPGSRRRLARILERREDQAVAALLLPPLPPRPRPAPPAVYSGVPGTSNGILVVRGAGGSRAAYRIPDPRTLAEARRALFRERQERLADAADSLERRIGDVKRAQHTAVTAYQDEILNRADDSLRRLRELERRLGALERRR